MEYNIVFASHSTVFLKQAPGFGLKLKEESALSCRTTGD
jgi:hypothetical protein